MKNIYLWHTSDLCKFLVNKEIFIKNHHFSSIPFECYEDKTSFMKIKRNKKRILNRMVREELMTKNGDFG